MHYSSLTSSVEKSEDVVRLDGEEAKKHEAIEKKPRKVRAWPNHNRSAWYIRYILRVGDAATAPRARRPTDRCDGSDDGPDRPERWTHGTSRQELLLAFYLYE